jgi:dynein heavy chain
VLQYRFSSATLFRIFRGLHFCTLSCCDEPVKLILFWLHEVMRTVVDVLSAVDRERFLKSLGDTVKKEFSHFHVSKYFSGPAHPEAETILFSHLSSDLDAGSLVCEKVDSVADAKASIAQQLADDAAFSDVILFDDAVVTVLKVTRALALHNEGLLMVGPDASGKALLVRLASFLFGMTTRQLDLDEGYSDLKFRADWLDLVSAAVLQHEKMVVLVSEIDIADDEVGSTVIQFGDALLSVVGICFAFRTNGERRQVRVSLRL